VQSEKFLRLVYAAALKPQMGFGGAPISAIVMRMVASDDTARIDANQRFLIGTLFGVMLTSKQLA
jgi:hypothetical protein